MVIDGRYPVYGANGVIGRYDQFNHGERELIIGCRGACGTVHFTEPEAWITGNSMVVHPTDDRINLDYLGYFFRGPANLDEIVTGAAQPQITRKSLAPVAVPLPPLEEQQRIVAILDEAFEGLDRAKANAEANLASSRELLCQLMTTKVSGTSDGRVMLSEICDVRDGTHDTPKYVERGVPLVTQKNIRPHGLCTRNTKHISEQEHTAVKRRSAVERGDILISMIGANRGMACLVDIDEEFSIKNVGLMRKCPQYNMRFLLYFLQSTEGQNYIESATNGGAQPFVGLGKLRAFPVPNPPLEVQEKVAAEVGELVNAADALGARYTAMQRFIDQLRQSLLAKAFAGGLT